VAYIFYFFTLSKGIDEPSVFTWLRFVDKILLSHPIFFSSTCTSVKGGIMIKQKTVVVQASFNTGNAQVRERRKCISEA